MSVRLPGRTISIHAPRTGSDGACRWRLDSPAHFNPRSPHGERPRFTTARGAPCSFQSTLPARGATVAALSEKSGISFQSTLPARGATPPKHGSTRIPGISIHAPRTGSDRDWKRGAENPERISIHAPRTGSDFLPLTDFGWLAYFNPRSPHGERQTLMSCSSATWNFNPRSPHGERPA